MSQYRRHHHRPKRYYYPHKVFRPRRTHTPVSAIIRNVVFILVPLVIVGVIVASFLGVQPLASVKDKVVAAITDPFVVDAGEAQVIENEVFLLINQARQENGLPPLQRDSFMDLLARQHCDYMKTTGFQSHNGFEDRANQIISHSGASRVGENVAVGYSDAPSLVRIWLASPGHRENIMDPDFTRTGIGYIDGVACQIFSD